MLPANEKRKARHEFMNFVKPLLASTAAHVSFYEKDPPAPGPITDVPVQKVVAEFLKSKPQYEQFRNDLIKLDLLSLETSKWEKLNK